MKARIGCQTVDLEIDGRVKGVREARHISRKAEMRVSQVLVEHTQIPGRNAQDKTQASLSNGILASEIPRQQVRSDAHAPFSFTLVGQIRGGKNNMKVGRNGKHYPDKTFAKWRDEAVREARKHLSRQPIPYFPKPLILEIEVHYAAGDLRRRDIPGMLDALFHVLERAQVVEDDAQIKESHWYELPVDKTNPHVKVTVKERRA